MVNETEEGERRIVVLEGEARDKAERDGLRDALRSCVFALGRLGANALRGPGRAEWERARDALADSDACEALRAQKGA